MGDQQVVLVLGLVALMIAVAGLILVKAIQDVKAEASKLADRVKTLEDGQLQAAKNRFFTRPMHMSPSERVRAVEREHERMRARAAGVIPMGRKDAS